MTWKFLNKNSKFNDVNYPTLYLRRLDIALPTLLTVGK